MHLKLLLKERGFKLTNEDLLCGSRSKSLKRDKKDNALKYDSENYDLLDLLKSRINIKLLHIYDTKVIRLHKQLINDSSLIHQHLNVKYLFTWDNEMIKNKLDSNKDFGLIKMKSSINQIQYITKVLDLFNMNKVLEIDQTKTTKNIDYKDLLNEYKTRFRDRSTKPIKLNTDYDKIKFVASKLYSKLNIPMSNYDKKENGIKITKYQVDLEALEMHSDLIKYSTRQYKNIDTDYMLKCGNDKIQLLKTEMHIELLKQ
tara:strand:+ start:81 stop:854 length:774 start_codon:yes stop_codon:yes gene_type:complete